ncbi:hypothetical protein [Butyrivibrio sp. AE2005]|uniref:hypothetical protein n=1 Tax=Butyrivibrio sp. AE2005 TaxID=1496722 RepID=UPI00047DE11F|nr:hypothetical protein [Butyrivibrio sp. AE2005]
MSHEYLSDEELQKLISDVELNDMAEAPVGLQKKVLDAVDAADKAGNIAKTKKQKIIEYRLYSLKVALAVAAAIAVMFIVPCVSAANRYVPFMEKIVSQRDISLKEELFVRKESKNCDEELNEKGFREHLIQKKEKIERKINNIFIGDMEEDDGI